MTRCIGQHIGEGSQVYAKGQELSFPPGHHHPGTSTGSAMQKFSEPSPFGLLWRLQYVAMLDYVMALGDQLKFSPLSSLEAGIEVKPKFQLSSHVLVFTVASSHPDAIWGSPATSYLISIQKTNLSLGGESKVLGNGMKTKCMYYILLQYHNHIQPSYSLNSHQPWSIIPFSKCS